MGSFNLSYHPSRFSGASGHSLDAICRLSAWRQTTVIQRKPFKQEAALDDGQWLRPLLAGTTVKVRWQPDAATLVRIREAVLGQIERESVSLVA